MRPKKTIILFDKIWKINSFLFAKPIIKHVPRTAGIEYMDGKEILSLMKRIDIAIKKTPRTGSKLNNLLDFFLLFKWKYAKKEPANNSQILTCKK